ncbi:hypothetical protein SAMN02799630_05408 [Paenibacillus sp. UNCCL117]|nr:hypothetical protein SAMN04488602_12958 [Paenibacillus sp. cl123]SFW65697.1 hypothetical protein SAMN02799630_05408 [Paenibacillus sp. UNCCL117]
MRRELTEAAQGRGGQKRRSKELGTCRFRAERAADFTEQPAPRLRPPLVGAQSAYHPLPLSVCSFRNSPGVCPVHFLKARRKEAGSENPRAYEMSVTEKEGFFK